MTESRVSRQSVQVLIQPSSETRLSRQSAMVLIRLTPVLDVEKVTSKNTPKEAQHNWLGTALPNADAGNSKVVNEAGTTTLEPSVDEDPFNPTDTDYIRNVGDSRY